MERKGGLKAKRSFNAEGAVDPALKRHTIATLSSSAVGV
jgi:hypothetical protein